MDAGQSQLHVKLQAPGPGERFAVLGSHEAFGCWNLTSGVQLEWRGSAWETPTPIPISPCERVEFKFVRIRPGGLDWESGPNRVTEFPNYKGDLCLQGIFNGESILQPSDAEIDAEGISTPDTMQSARAEDDADLWQLRYHEAVKQLTAQIPATLRAVR
ncbi:GWD3 [Symbiodinium natans]|uniref:GWD3 protein n=1 Tax=Symbiodinium natans TaxID=878477 RepID=A0A812RJX8_9DINO|nr:GWD3 [Symbiodinium natans]